jgi:hypothetical protein
MSSFTINSPITINNTFSSPSLQNTQYLNCTNFSGTNINILHDNIPPLSKGNITSNKSCGQAIITAGTRNVTVTNNKVTSSSIVLATLASNDSSLIAIQVVAGNGSFTIYGGPILFTATNDCKVNWLVIN